jgi:hypothetical protein
MRLVLLCLAALGFSACASQRTPGPFTPFAPVAAEKVVVTGDEVLAIARAHLAATSDTSYFDMAAAYVSEGPGEWLVAFPYRGETLPRSTGYRVSKATGQAFHIPGR